MFLSRLPASVFCIIRSKVTPTEWNDRGNLGLGCPGVGSGSTTVGVGGKWAMGNGKSGWVARALVSWVTRIKQKRQLCAEQMKAESRIVEGARLLCLHCQQSRKSVRITQNSRLLLVVALALCFWTRCLYFDYPATSFLVIVAPENERGATASGASCGTDKVSAPSCSFQLHLHSEKCTEIIKFFKVPKFNVENVCS